MEELERISMSVDEYEPARGSQDRLIDRKSIRSLHLFLPYKLEGKMCEELKKEINTKWESSKPPARDPCCCFACSCCWSFLCCMYTPSIFRFGVKKYEKDACKPYLSHLDACVRTNLTVPKRDGNDRAVNMAMFRPKTLSKDVLAPAVIYMHGGGYMGGGVDQTAPLNARDTIENNLVVFSVEYRLVPEGQHPYIHLDSYVCIKHVYQHARALRIDPARICLKGEGAGGYHVHAAAAKLAMNNESYMVRFCYAQDAGLYGYSLTEPIENMTQAEKVQQGESEVVSEWMAGSEKEKKRLLKEADPLMFPDLVSTKLLESYPPFVIVNREFDLFITTNNRLADRMKKLGLLLEHIVYPGIGHMQRHADDNDNWKEIVDLYLKS